ncbi:MAG: sensor histidine kinase [Clostridiaceae bacterium]|nr:sensor histidine kinase [Clostridiaceae bacterium]
MKDYLVDSTRMNDIFKKIIVAIEESKTEIFDIAENIRKEMEELKNQLKAIKEHVHELIKEVDKLEVLEKKSRMQLLHVSRDFNKYNEEDIRQAYESANNLQIQLILKRQEEQNFIKKRTEVEIRLKNTERTLEKAEGLTSRIGVVQEFLGGNLEDINNTLEDIKQRHIIGKKIIRAQEEERKRVARDIHDGPAQSLANVVIKAEVCEKLINVDIEKSRRELQELKKCVRESIKDIRKIIYNLRPTSIDDIGLVPTVQRYIKDFQMETGIEVDFIILSQIDLEDPIKSLSIFRIIQEALNNVKKHAEAKSVKIRVEMTGTDLSLIIADNGIGFDMDILNIQTTEDSGFGLLNIKERAELLKGRLIIESQVNQGTKIVVNIPRVD